MPKQVCRMPSLAVALLSLSFAPIALAQDVDLNEGATQAACPALPVGSRLAGLVDIAPDGTGTTAQARECIALKGNRRAAQVARAIEVSDGARGPASGPGIATAASASYALSLVNTRPDWRHSDLAGESDGLSIFVRQGKGDTAAMLSNVGVRHGFAATLESYTFSADAEGRPIRAVRTQLGVVNPRDGGEFGLLVQASEGQRLTAGLRIASLGTANWANYLEAISPAGETVAAVRGSDGAFVGGDLLPTSDLGKNVGSPAKRYAATYTQVLQLAETTFSSLPACGGGAGAGTLAFVSDAEKAVTAWGQAIRAGGGRNKTFVKCNGFGWTAF